MRKPSGRIGWALAVWLLALSSRAPAIEPPTWVPEPLRPWIPWVLHGHEAQSAPPRWDDANQRRTVWPGRLELEATSTGARFSLEVRVFAESWVALPGDENLWPGEVTANGKPHPVVLRQQRPAVRLAPGEWRLEGSFHWRQIPLRMAVPSEIGLLDLTLQGQRIPHPSWDKTGWLWFRAPPAPPEPRQEPDLLAADWFGVLEDGHPQWLRVEVQLSVAGRPREEVVGAVLPEGWQLAHVRSPIPVLVDEQGRLKAQVRPGQWQVQLDAFRIGRGQELRFSPEGRPPGGVVLLGLQANPAFRVVELEGAEQVDATQTRFPERWRGLPVYRWDTQQGLRIVERVRGQGSGPAPRLSLRREWWLDEDGRALTFRDLISGSGQTLWRLDVVEGVDLGSARVRGEGLLLTRNPATGRPGFELRVREFTAECVGRQTAQGPLPATGWMVSADELTGTLHLPVGWRLLALWGPDRVHGDWLRQWTLLDLFGVLVFVLAVQQLLGWRAGLVALVAAVLAYHEPGAPRLVWWVVILLMALLRLVRTARAELVLRTLQAAGLLWLVIVLVPFVGRQLQQALYPQLEMLPEQAPLLVTEPPAADREASPADAGRALSLMPARRKIAGIAAFESQAPSAAVGTRLTENLGLDISARIQTGPGVPEWTWRRVEFEWNGPVRPDQTMRWWLIPRWLERCLSALRAFLLLWLAFLLVRGSARSATGRPASMAGTPLAPRPAAGASGAGALIALLLAGGGSQPLAAADFPPPELLNQLRERLLAAPPAFPGAAEIPSASLSLSNQQVVLEARIEAAATCAVPLPARFAQWSPLRVSLNGISVTALRREDDSLWVVVPPGVHRVRLEGLLEEVDEWVWSFLLRPRQVEVDAPGWSVSGIGPDGVPQSQVILRREASARPTGARMVQPAVYDQQPLVPAFQVVRDLELGLRWKVRTIVRRLSPPVRGAVLAVPILPGERILTGGVTARDGRVEVNLAPGQSEFTWESELAAVEVLLLETRASDTWAEQWRLRVGPVWNVAFEELAPVHEEGPDLIPVWRPWPGETTRLRVSRPEPLPGVTLTVRSVEQVTEVGHRLRTTRLQLRVLSSLGQDFVLEVPKEAEVQSVQRDGTSLPPQRVGDRLLVPVVPGEQQIQVTWKEVSVLQSRIRPSAVRLPVDAANVRQVVHLPNDRWVLGTRGPVLGPAVRFWGMLVLAAVLAVILSRHRVGPSGQAGWFLLLVGLTQVPVWLAWLVVAWFAVMQLRGGWNLAEQRWWLADLFQLTGVVLTVMALLVLYLAVSAGLLGRVEMFITGNGSTTWEHRWFTPRCGPNLPQPETWAVSLWWYRLAMLAWALWLAVSLLRWLRWAWIQFSTGGCWLWPPKKRPPTTPPVVGGVPSSPGPASAGDQR